VDSSEPAESWDLYASMFGGIPLSELDALADFWQALPSLRAALFTNNGTPYAAPQVEDLAQATREHPEVKNYSQTFTAAFADFTPWLRRALLEQMLTLQIPRQEALISEALFARLAPLPHIDKYHAYQILDDHWQPIAIDLEILQTEGFDASRVVDPNLVSKKKDGKDVEVQDGWKGRIMPFELVQMTHHKKELNALREKENRLSEITASLEEILESLSEEEKAFEAVNDAGDKFVNATVAKEAKLLLAESKKSVRFDPESWEAKIIQAADWLAEEKTLKAAIKQEAAALHLQTKKTIEGLSDAQVYELLERKWIIPLSDALHSLPDQQIDDLTRRLDALVQKYQITYADNAREIEQTETELAGMIEKLDANEFDHKGLTEFKTLLTGS
jgi:type I restriction enzyme M protein